LKSSDNQIITVRQEIAEQSKVIKALLEGKFPTWVVGYVYAWTYGSCFLVSL